VTTCSRDIGSRPDPPPPKLTGDPEASKLMTSVRPLLQSRLHFVRDNRHKTLNTVAVEVDAIVHRLFVHRPNRLSADRDARVVGGDLLKSFISKRHVSLLDDHSAKRAEKHKQPAIMMQTLAVKIRHQACPSIADFVRQINVRQSRVFAVSVPNREEPSGGFNFGSIASIRVRLVTAQTSSFKVRLAACNTLPEPATDEALCCIDQRNRLSDGRCVVCHAMRRDSSAPFVSVAKVEGQGPETKRHDLRGRMISQVSSEREQNALWLKSGMAPQVVPGHRQPSRVDAAAAGASTQKDDVIRLVCCDRVFHRAQHHRLVNAGLTVGIEEA
jgi:hypothetical protein